MYPKWLGALMLGAAILMTVSACSHLDSAAYPPPLNVEGRAVWVARYHYGSPEDVVKIMENCAEHGFNEVIFQVRGNATVYYDSDIEPWAYELSGDDPANTGKDPGWDPLAVAVEEAHKRGLVLQAWVNVYPGWRGREWPPEGVPQLWNEHPEWFMRWKDGGLMLPYYMRNEEKVVWYSFINPAVPEVNDYLLGVMGELAMKYDIDGIHMDYVRYPHDLKGWDFSYDPVSLNRFKAETGHTPDEAPAEWADWRAAQVTSFVSRLYKQLQKESPGVALTAAVAGNHEHGRGNMQYSHEWIHRGSEIVDALYLMNYNRNTTQYYERVVDAVQASGGPAIYSGMGPYRFQSEPDAAEKFRAQMYAAKAAGASGVAQFSYVTLFDGESHEPTEFAKILKEEFYQKSALSPLSIERGD